MIDHIGILAKRAPELSSSIPALRELSSLLVEVFSRGGKLLLCGNGGSCADCDHIAGELLKAYLKPRELDASLAARLDKAAGSGAPALGRLLRRGLPAISLCAHASLLTAMANDVVAELGFAQEVMALGKPGDLLLGISTSGKARNVQYALIAARELGLSTAALTGLAGAFLAERVDILVVAPSTETPRVQEEHLALYHALCAQVEESLF